MRYRTPDIYFGPKYENSYLNQRITERENQYKHAVDFFNRKAKSQRRAGDEEDPQDDTLPI